MARVRLQGLYKRFGAQVVIDDINLDVPQGEFLTLLGPSGCGKTTTLRMVAGFNSPDAGRVLFDNDDVTAAPPQKRQLGMVFQDYTLFPHLSVADNVGFALRERGVSKGDIARRVNELLALIRLPKIADRFPTELSGGQQQRVAIARALAHTPKVLLMDEPLGALDLKLREAMQDELHAIQRQLGITTIYVTHDQEEALSLSHRIALMRNGRIEQIDTPHNIYAAPRTAFAAYFLGKINFLRGRLSSRDGEGYDVSLSDGTILRCAARSGVGDLATDQTVLLGVRPEHIKLGEIGSANAHENALSGRITRTRFAGKATQLEIEVADGAKFLVDIASLASEVGSTVGLIWDPGNTLIFPFVADSELGLTTTALEPVAAPGGVRTDPVNEHGNAHIGLARQCNEGLQ